MAEPMSETRRTYDAITAEYARSKSSVDPHVRDDVRALAVTVPPGSLVADVGCGPGQEMTILREHGFRVVGFDLSLGQLRTARLPGVAQADMRHLPLRVGVLDAVWCQAALLHIARREVPVVLAEFARVVRVGGALFLSVAEGDGEQWETADRYGSTHRRWYTYHRLPDLVTLLDDAGFEVGRLCRVAGHRDWLCLHCRRVAR
ncbi:class I SAM-dependent methyltransferase [Micromonospora sp. NPDC050397]|uniref:class I SAM-dependent methyltransferase n=1 Tax=Micromonospora sp. NPDC050397 TaxID=3364279 RepID=UPI00384C536B